MLYATNAHVVCHATCCMALTLWHARVQACPHENACTHARAQHAHTYARMHARTHTQNAHTHTPSISLMCAKQDVGGTSFGLCGTRLWLERARPVAVLLWLPPTPEPHWSVCYVAVPNWPNTNLGTAVRFRDIPAKNNLRVVFNGHSHSAIAALPSFSHCQPTICRSLNEWVTVNNNNQ